MKREDQLKIKIISSLSLLVIVISISLMGSVLYKDVFAPVSKKLPIYSVETTDKRMCLTFDVNWGDDKTEEILDILDKYDVKATFYIIGLWCDDYPERVKEIYDRGHEIGNHSNRHPDFTKISKEGIMKDLNIANAKIMDITGEMPKTFRFPSGAYNDLAVDTVEGMGLKCIQWDVDSVDWKALGEEIEYQKVISKAREGSILLFHSDGKYTPQNLSRIIEKYQSEGYDFMKISEMIYRDNYHLNHEGRQIINKK